MNETLIPTMQLRFIEKLINEPVNVFGTYKDGKKMSRVLQQKFYTTNNKEVWIDVPINGEQLTIVKPKGTAKMSNTHNDEKPPKWYQRNEIVSALRKMNYSVFIQEELSDWFTRHLQYAFNKGFQIGSKACATKAKIAELEAKLKFTGSTSAYLT